MNRKIITAFLIILPILAFVSFFEIANISEQRSDNSWLVIGIELSSESTKQKAIDLKNNKAEDISMINDIYACEYLTAFFATSTIITLILYNKKGKVKATSPL